MFNIYMFDFNFLCKFHLFDTQIADLFLCWGVDKNLFVHSFLPSFIHSFTLVVWCFQIQWLKRGPEDNFQANKSYIGQKMHVQCNGPCVGLCKIPRLVTIGPFPGKFDLLHVIVKN